MNDRSSNLIPSVHSHLSESASAGHDDYSPAAYTAAPKRTRRAFAPGIGAGPLSFRTIEHERLELNADGGPLVVTRDRGCLVRVSGNRTTDGDNRIEEDCVIEGENASLEIRGTLVTIGGTRAIVNRMRSPASESLVIAAVLKINDTPPMRKTVTLAGTGGIRVTGVVENNRGNGSLTCSGRVVIDGENNTYGGVTTIVLDATLVVRRLADAGYPSSIGLSSVVPSNLIVSGRLEYRSDRPSESDRLFTANSTSGTVIANESAREEASLAFTNPGELGLGAANMPRIVTLSGSNRGANRFSPALTDNGYATTALHKTGTGRWILAGNNRHTGGTVLRDGETHIAHPRCFGKGPVSIRENAVLHLGDAECPGVFAGPGLLLINGTLRLESAKASINIESDSFYVLNGTIDLNGVFDRMPPGEYPVIIGGAGAGRYVDNLRALTGYRRNGHLATFRQGKVIITKAG